LKHQATNTILHSVTQHTMPLTALPCQPIHCSHTQLQLPGHCPLLARLLCTDVSGVPSPLGRPFRHCSKFIIHPTPYCTATYSTQCRTQQYLSQLCTGVADTQPQLPLALPSGITCTFYVPFLLAYQAC
jgi:hypothetical protein